jgi:hypothetical protein
MADDRGQRSDDRWQTTEVRSRMLKKGCKAKKIITKTRKFESTKEEVYSEEEIVIQLKVFV